MPTPVELAESTAASILSRVTSGRTGSGSTTHIRAFETRHGRHLALVPGLKSIRAFSEPVADRAPTSFKHLKGRSYTADESRNHHLTQHAPRIANGRAADLWVFPTVGEFEAFALWYDQLPI